MRVSLFLSAVFLPIVLAAQGDGAAQEYAKLAGGYAKATAKYRVADAKVPALLPAKSPFHDEFVAAASRYAGTKESLPFLGWLLQNSPRNKSAHGAAVKAIDAMAKSRAAELRQSDDGKAEVVRMSKESRKAVRFLKYNVATDEVFAQTLLNAKVIALASTDEKLAQAAARSVFKLERLQIGMVAPEIAGKDLDGVAFKLSDYRGKAVVIDFWGDW